MVHRECLDEWRWQQREKGGLKECSTCGWKYVLLDTRGGKRYDRVNSCCAFWFLFLFAMCLYIPWGWVNCRYWVQKDTEGKYLVSVLYKLGDSYLAIIILPVIGFLYGLGLVYYLCCGVTKGEFLSLLPSFGVYHSLMGWYKMTKLAEEVDKEEDEKMEKREKLDSCFVMDLRQDVCVKYEP